ncbi:MAG: hypothetical protein KC418_03460 [Anaerolineales bacterium]|nr:hypothetical protein [Anaerolineales bacterium]MCB8951215.1 hypothetical protein [Ardenticatenales bacterium]
MLTTYMAMWSIVMIGAIALWRLRHPGQLLLISLVSLLVLLLSQTLFWQLSRSAGISPTTSLPDLAIYLQHGPVAWLALLVMPCGWLGPILGLSLVEKSRRLAE